MCRKSFIVFSIKQRNYDDRDSIYSVDLQRDDGASDSAGNSNLLSDGRPHEVAHRLARLDFVDGYAVGVGAGDGGGGPRPRRRIEGFELLYQIVVLSHEIIQRIVLLEDLRVHPTRRVRDPVRFSADPALERPAAQRLRGGELESGRGRRQGN